MFDWPMSSPQNTTMLGFLSCACATLANASAARTPMNLHFMFTPSFLECENLLPIVFHADHDPVVRRRRIQSLVELADVRLAVVCELARRVVVVDDEAEPPALAGCRDLQH